MSLAGVQHRVDVAAGTLDERAAAGLPEGCLVWPLRGDLLPETRVAVPGLHSVSMDEARWRAEG